MTSDANSGGEDARVPFADLTTFVEAVLLEHGVPGPDAELTARCLVRADARGMRSHGLTRLPNYAQRLRAGGVHPIVTLQILRETASCVLLDGGDGLGPVVAARATDAAIEKARTTGVGVAGVRRSNHFGEAGFFALQVAEAGMIGIVSTNGSPNMPPWGGLDKLFGTLPLAIAIPAAQEAPVVLDIAMGVVSKGKILLAAKQGETIPAGWGVDAQGNPTTDPALVLDGGWMQPIGGYKGSGLIFVLEVLNGLLTGSGVAEAIGDLYGDPSRPQNLGHLVIVIDVAAFVELQEFGRAVDSFIRLVRGSRLAAGHEELLLPGDRERLHEQAASELGVPVARETVDELLELALLVGAPTGVLESAVN